jgi:arylsulfatase A-like enzyme
MTIKDNRPNILLVVLDTHRVDRLGCYGYKKNTSPNIDAYAQRSAIFEKAISPAQWTIPAHASLFTGEYPSTHNVLQASDAIRDNFTTLAEYLNKSGYETIGFCNNPLVGVLDNGFRRGFDEFYNYGGTIPSRPSTSHNRSDSFLSRFSQDFRRLIHKVSTPIQQAVAASPEVLQFALNPLLVPLWTKYSNFKGDTPNSIKDTEEIVQTKFSSRNGKPAFIFLNLMETHLPFRPPKPFLRDFAPIVLDKPSAQNFIGKYNSQALKWLLPLEQPYPEIENQTLHQMYDAEVAYQDHLLNGLLSILDKPEFCENSMVVIVSDHGEMLGEHQLMGHGLGVYEELVHVPLIMRSPGQTNGTRVPNTVSTINVFHTILNSAGINSIDTPVGESVSTRHQSLLKDEINHKHAFSEAFPPHSLLLILEKYAPNLINQFHCKSTRWAVYNQPYKLIRTENLHDEYYNYQDDLHEENLLSLDMEYARRLSESLDDFLKSTTDKYSNYSKASVSNLDDDNVLDHLRQLGYID